MISSIDGRLLTDRWTPPAKGIADDLAYPLYEKTGAQFDADGWIVGRATMQEFADAKPSGIRAAAPFPRTTHVGDRGDRRLAIAVDPHGKLHYGTNDFDGDHIVAVLGAHVSDDYLAELRSEGISYVFAGADGRSLRTALDELAAAFSVKTLLLEGGGSLNGSFLKDGLIDEVSLLVYPGVDGLAGVPSIFEFIGKVREKPAAGRALRHLKTETLEGGIVWLHYRVEAAS